MAGSLNKVLLIGNLTRDPELKYTPTGVAVCTIGLATSRSWTTDAGEKREETEFHRLIAWRKLAEICGQYLFKGKKIYAEGRLVTRKYTAQDGQEKSITEVVLDNMIMLDNKRAGDEVPTPSAAPVQSTTSVPTEPEQSKPTASPEDTATVAPEDIPF